MSSPLEPVAEPHLRGTLTPGLYIVSTPIGNLRDVTLRALDVLRSADRILAEDTRHSRRLLDHYGVTTPLSPYHDHNGAEARPRILADLEAGGRLALISDAGTPLVSDPGYKLVRDAAARGFAVIPVPGPSAVLAALSVAGLPTDRFVFLGFMPPRAAARRRELAAFARTPATLVLYEAPQRLAETLADLADICGERPAVVARELTKTYEEIVRAPLGALARRFAEAPARGEVVVLVAPPDGDALWDAPAVDAALQARMRDASVKSAAAEIAALSGWAKRDVYARALALRGEANG